MFAVKRLSEEDRKAREEAHKDGVAMTATRLQRAILTLHAVGDPDRWIRVQKKHGLEYKSEWSSYSSEEVPVRFRPTAKDCSRYLDDLACLNTLLQQPDGRRDVKIIWARAFKVGWRRLGERHGRNERTIQRWYEGAIAFLYAKHRDQLGQ